MTMGAGGAVHRARAREACEILGPAQAGWPIPTAVVVFSQQECSRRMVNGLFSIGCLRTSICMCKIVPLRSRRVQGGGK